MTTPRDALVSMREYLRRARHAASAISFDPQGQEILRLVMRAEDFVGGWLQNAGSLIETPSDQTPDIDESISEQEIAEVLAGLKSITTSPASVAWATSDHVAERIHRPLPSVIGALGAAAKAGLVESVYHYTLSHRGEDWMRDEGDALLEDS